MWRSRKFLFLCVEDALNLMGVLFAVLEAPVLVPGRDFLIRSLMSPRKFTAAKFILPVNSAGYVSSALSIRSFRVSREIPSRVLAWIPVARIVDVVARRIPIKLCGFSCSRVDCDIARVSFRPIKRRTLHRYI